MAQIKNMNNENNTYMNQNMVLSIVTLATKEIKGVVDVYQSKKLSFKRLFFKNIGKGVTIRDTQNGMVIDVYVIVSTDPSSFTLTSIVPLEFSGYSSLTSLYPSTSNSLDSYSSPS